MARDADPLAALVVDETAVAREELAAALAPYIQLGSSGDVWPTDAFSDLTARHQVLALMLALRAAELLGLRDSGTATPAELVELSNMAAGTVRPKLSELARDRLVAKEGSAYSVPAPAARRAAAELGRARG